MDFLLRAVMQVAGFLLFQTILLHLVEKTKFEKYIKLVSGFLLILMVCSLVFSLFGESNLMEEVFRQVEYTEASSDYQLKLQQAEENQKSQILKGYEERILDEVKTCISDSRFFYVSGRVELGGDGQLEHVYLVVSRSYQKEDVEGKDDGKSTVSSEEESSVKVVEPVEIEPVEWEGRGQDAGVEEGKGSKEGEPAGDDGGDAAGAAGEVVEAGASVGRISDGDKEWEELNKELAIRLGISREQVSLTLQE